MMNEVTVILQKIEGGDELAASQLYPLVYDELRQIAAAKLSREAPGQTLNSTALVNEAYLRMVGPDNAPKWPSRGYFFGAAAEAMRRILVDNARRKKTDKHGGQLNRQDFEEAQLAEVGPSEDVIALNDALDKLAAKDTKKAELVKLRYFAGLTNAQAAKALGISTATAERYWSYSRAWLHREMINQTD